MTRTQLDAAYAETIARYWRVLSDDGGTASKRLLDELAGIADKHAADSAHAPIDVTGQRLADGPPVARKRAGRGAKS